MYLLLLVPVAVLLLVAIVALMRPKRNGNSNPSPEEAASLLGRLSFAWMSPLMRLGAQKPLEGSDLWPLANRDAAATNSELFQRAWAAQCARAARSGRRPSLVRAVATAFGPVFLSAAAFKATQDVLAFAQPMLLRRIMDFAHSYAQPPSTMAEEPQPISVGVSIALGMLAAALAQTVVLHQYFHIAFVTGMRIRSALATAVYSKSLRLSPHARAASTTGEIVNLMSVDATRIADLCSYLQILWSGPFQISLAVFFLYEALGPAIFAGIGMMLLMVPVNAVLAARARTISKAMMANKDRRTKLMDEALAGIKIIKLYAWEPSFLARIRSIRDAELATLKASGILSAAQSFTWFATPFLVSLSSFAVYSIVSNEPLTSTKAFVALSLFNLLQFPLSVFPSVISATIEASVSFSRLAKFLNLEDLDQSAVNYEPVPPTVDPSQPVERICVKDASFAWTVPDSVSLIDSRSTGSISRQTNNDQDATETTPLLDASNQPSSVFQPTISDISFSVSDAQLIAVVGIVGSGKSTLISALLGEPYRLTGTVTIRGSVAYIPQTPWIMNATVRDNILFGSPYIESRYKSTLFACGLVPDMEMLPGGDMCEIGEKGVTLSGGQKQRVSIARAVYADADIYVMDDPLSAVDAHVGRHIFKNVIGPDGLLKSKARVLVTHAIHVLHQVDYVMVMQGGRVVERGTYHDLVNNKNDGLLYMLAKEYGKQQESHENLDTEMIENGETGASVVGSSEPPQSIIEASDSVEEEDKKKQEMKKEVGGSLMTTEESAKGSVDSSVYVAYARACRWWSVTIFLLLSVLTQACSIVQNIVLSMWADSNDHASIDGGSRADPWAWLKLYAAIGATSCLLVVGQVAFVWVYCGIRSARELHDQMLKSVFRLPQSFFDTTPLGRILNRFSKDIYTIDETLPRSFLGYFRTLFSVINVLIVNTVGSPLFIVFAIPLGFMYSYFQRFYLCTSRELKRLESTTRSPVYAHFQETLGGVTTIRAYKLEHRFIETNESRLDMNQRAYYPSVSSNRWLAVRLETIGSLIVFSSALFGVVGISSGFGNVSAALVGLMLTYALSVTQSLNWMVRQSCEIETNIVSVERIQEYIELNHEAPYVYPQEESIEELQDDLKLFVDMNEDCQNVTTVSEDWPTNGSISFVDYSTRYRPGLDLALRNVSFSISAGEKVGIVGRTGSGKSTLTLSLFRLLEPVSGTILIDGVDITTIGLHTLRSRLSIVPQDFFLFSDTLRSNLDPLGEYTDDVLWDVLDIVKLKEFVANRRNVSVESDSDDIANGLDMVVSPGGENLSVGQRQLVCLARALLRSKPRNTFTNNSRKTNSKNSILVLDEATAAIDHDTDAWIQSAIRTNEAFQNATVVTIAHRINTVMDYDKIVVMDVGGVVVEVGSPNELLMKKNGAFALLAKEAGVKKKNKN